VRTTIKMIVAMLFLWQQRRVRFWEYRDTAWL